ncbi:MAG: sel1 repeat family protein, partial [Campylobacteraceae bacterium]|nr:sel1 repeat family protein [Campylobacteraceae bacterium]
MSNNNLSQEAYNAIISEDYNLAYKLYSYLVEQNDPVSYYYLGFLYFKGFGVDQDISKAFEYYLEAAIREVTVAQFEVALMLEDGNGCTKNESEAAFWYEEAAKRGNMDAYNNLGAMFKEG